MTHWVFWLKFPRVVQDPADFGNIALTMGAWRSQKSAISWSQKISLSRDRGEEETFWERIYWIYYLQQFHQPNLGLYVIKIIGISRDKGIMAKLVGGDWNMAGLWLSIYWEWNNRPNWRTHIFQFFPEHDDILMGITLWLFNIANWNMVHKMVMFHSYVKYC